MGQKMVFLKNKELARKNLHMNKYAVRGIICRKIACDLLLICNGTSLKRKILCG